MKHHFHAFAWREHLERATYFESQRPGLGARYLDDFDATIARVCEAPGRLYFSITTFHSLSAWMKNTAS